MISGVRASSIRMLSTSSTIANLWSRWKHRSSEPRHVVAQVVEAELGVGAVGDVGGVASARRVGRVVVLLDPDLDAEGAVDGLHPFGVAAGQVVVDGDDVDAVARQRVEEDGQRRGQGLALAGLHLRDRARVQDHAADQLDVVVALSEHPLARLAAERKSLGQQVVERLSPAGPLRSLSASTRISSSASSSISASKRLIASTRFSSSLNCFASPRRSARSIIPLAIAD